MDVLRTAPGFLGTQATLLTDINLAVQILFYILLCLGVMAQRKKKYHLHDRFQTPVVVLNLLFIGLVMIPSARFVAREIPARLQETYYLIPTIHMVLGTLAEGLAIYCMLAGFKILPRKIGMLRYFMWTTFILWTASVLFGIGIYIVWYGAPYGVVQVGPEAAAVVEHNAEEETAAPEETVPEEAAPEEVVEADTPTPAEPTATPTEAPPTPTPAPVLLAQAVWQTVQTTNSGPSPRYRHAMYYNQSANELFIFGGQDGTTRYNDAWALNLTERTWREIGANSPTKPPARSDTVMIVNNETQKLYVATGLGDGGTFFNDVWQLDLATETWTDLSASAGTPPEPRYGSAGGALSGSLLLTHGCGAAAYDDTWFFDTQSAQWFPFAPGGEVPSGRCLTAATLGGPDLTMHSGCATGENDCTLEDTWLVATNSIGWQAILGDVDSAGRQHQSIVSADNNSYLLLYGGQGEDGTAQGELWLLEWSSGNWYAFGSDNAPAPRYYHTAAWIHDIGMIVFGGQNEEGALGDVQLLLVRPFDVQPGLMTQPTPEPTAATEPTATPAVEPTPEPTPTPVLISPPESPEHDETP